jgi:hypothetical protein
VEKKKMDLNREMLLRERKESEGNPTILSANKATFTVTQNVEVTLFLLSVEWK